MAYGSVLKYPYKDTDENGVEIEKTLNLKFSLTTLTKYHGYVGRDLMSDMAKLSRKSSKMAKLADMTDEELVTYIGDLSDEEYDNMFGNSHSIEFYGDLVAAMICTYYRTENLDFEEVRDNIPLYLLQDNDFIEKVMSLLSPGIKKN